MGEKYIPPDHPCIINPKQKPMKSGNLDATLGGIIINPARFHMTFENQIIIT